MFTIRYDWIMESYCVWNVIVMTFHGQTCKYNTYSFLYTYIVMNENTGEDKQIYFNTKLQLSGKIRKPYVQSFIYKMSISCLRLYCSFISYRLLSVPVLVYSIFATFRCQISHFRSVLLATYICRNK